MYISLSCVQVRMAYQNSVTLLHVKIIVWMWNKYTNVQVFGYVSAYSSISSCAIGTSVVASWSLFSVAYILKPYTEHKATTVT
jgi:hypothetical protein